MENSDNLLSGKAGARRSGTSTSLLNEVKEGDAEAWQRLVSLFSPLVAWWCRRNGLHAHDVEDVVQEVFRTVAGRIGEFAKRHETGSFRVWLRRITVNKIGDHLRRTRCEPPGIGGSDMLHRLEQIADINVSSDAEQDAPSERTLLCRRALELLRPEFEPRTWEAAWRTAVEGQSAVEVAADLTMSPGAVYTAKSRVLSRLRQELTALGESDTDHSSEAL